MPRLTMTLRQAALAGALAVGGVLALTAGTRTPPPSAIDRLAIAERDRRAARIVYPMGQAPRLTLPGGGTQPVRSVLNVGHVLRFGDYVWNDAGIAPAGAAAPLSRHPAQGASRVCPPCGRRRGRVCAPARVFPC